MPWYRLSVAECHNSGLLEEKKSVIGHISPIFNTLILNFELFKTIFSNSSSLVRTWSALEWSAPSSKKMRSQTISFGYKLMNAYACKMAFASVYVVYVLVYYIIAMWAITRTLHFCRLVITTDFDIGNVLLFSSVKSNTNQRRKKNHY